MAALAGTPMACRKPIGSAWTAPTGGSTRRLQSQAGLASAACRAWNPARRAGPVVPSGALQTMAVPDRVTTTSAAHVSTVTTSSPDLTSAAAEEVADKTYVLLLPDARLEWLSLSDHEAVGALVGGHFGSDRVITRWLGPAGYRGAGALRLMASDLCLTGHYEANANARRVIAEISHGYVSQRWGGVVALVEYERDPTTGEAGFPRPMSDERVRQIAAFCSRIEVTDLHSR